MENYNRLFLLQDPEMSDAERIDFIRVSAKTADYEKYIKEDTERKPGHINLSQIDESRGFIKMEGLKNFEAPVFNLETGEFEVGNLFDFVHDIALGDQLSDIQQDALTEIEIKSIIEKAHDTEPQKYEHTISEYNEEAYVYTELIRPSDIEEFIVAENIADGTQNEFVLGAESIYEVKFVLYNGVVVEQFVVNEYEGDGEFIGKTTVSIIDVLTQERVTPLEGARISIYGTTFKLSSLKDEISVVKNELQSIEDEAPDKLDEYSMTIEQEKAVAMNDVEAAHQEVIRIESEIVANKKEYDKNHDTLVSSTDEASILKAKNNLIDLGRNGLELKRKMSEAVSKFETLKGVLSLMIEDGELVPDPEGTDAYEDAKTAANEVRSNNSTAFNAVSMAYDKDLDTLSATFAELKDIADRLKDGSTPPPPAS